MLAMNKYPQDYIESCRSRVDAQLDEFRNLVAAAKTIDAKNPSFDKALAAVESAFFNNMIIVLDSYFTYRTRAVELKDGNPLNEVRVMASSMLSNGEIMMADSTIKLNPAKSVLKYEIGDKIRVTEQDFQLIAKAFFDEIEVKFAE
jgi:hypothetical protein